jgi:NAD(P)-dependent dehydrogenase (short-subunit alcohol dehydrogenase family)
MDLELAGWRAVVTGGSRGIGLAAGRALAAEGADVALVARDKDALARAAEQVAAVRQGHPAAGQAGTSAGCCACCRAKARHQSWPCAGSV